MGSQTEIAIFDEILNAKSPAIPKLFFCQPEIQKSLETFISTFRQDDKNGVNDVLNNNFYL